MRRKNVKTEQKHEIEKQRQQGWSAKQTFEYYKGTRRQIDLSTIYKYRREGAKSAEPQPHQAEHLHHQTLRRLIQSWLDEVRQLKLEEALSLFLESVGSAPALLRIAQLKAQVNPQTQSQSDRAFPQVLERRHWEASAQKDAHFRELYQHLREDPVWPFYVEMSNAWGEFVMTLYYWVARLEDYVASLMVSEEKDPNAWFERLRRDAAFRELVASVVQPAFFLLCSELVALAMAESPAGQQPDFLRFVTEQLQLPWEHKLQGCCSLFGFELSGDKVRHSAKRLWDGEEVWKSQGRPLRDDLLRVLKLRPACQASKDALQQRLAALVEQHPFPGQCDACPV